MKRNLPNSGGPPMKKVQCVLLGFFQLLCCYVSFNLLFLLLLELTLPGRTLISAAICVAGVCAGAFFWMRQWRDRWAAGPWELWLSVGLFWLGCGLLGMTGINETLEAPAQLIRSLINEAYRAYMRAAEVEHYGWYLVDPESWLPQAMVILLYTLIAVACFFAAAPSQQREKGEEPSVDG